MKKYNGLIILILFLITQCLGQAQSSNEIIVPLSNLQSIGTLSVNVHNANISVTGTDRNDILVRYQQINQQDEHHRNMERKHERPNDKKLGSLRKIKSHHIELEIIENDNEVKIAHALNPSILLVLDIEVPQNFNLDLATHMGESIKAKNVVGEINIESHVCSIFLDNISGPVNANTYSGTITATLKDISQSEHITYTSYSGEIDLTIPSNSNANFKIKTGIGEILTDLDLTIQEKEPEVTKGSSNGKYRAYINSWTHAILNNGGSEIKIKSEVGTIYLRGN